MSNKNPQETPQPEKKPNAPKQRRLGLDIPKDLVAEYANAAMIANTPAEMVIDFVQVLPRAKNGKVVSRVIMSPIHAKMLQRALTHNIAQYESQFGQIRVPKKTNLADQFFKLPPKDKDDKGE